MADVHRAVLFLAELLSRRSRLDRLSARVSRRVGTDPRAFDLLTAIGRAQDSAYYDYRGAVRILEPLLGFLAAERLASEAHLLASVRTVRPSEVRS